MKALLLGIVALLAIGQSYAQVPETLAYSARLSTSTGTPVAGTQALQFALYDVATGGTALWSESQSVSISNGELSVTLGETVPIPRSAFSRRLYLGIKVGSDAEMTPRPKLNAAPYSVRSATLLARTLHVSADGTSTANGTALKAAVLTLTPFSAIQLDAGFYDLGTESISLPANTSLRGAGRTVSIIRSSNSDATVILGAGALAADLEANNTGVSATQVEGASAFALRGGGARLSGVSARSDLQSAPTGFRNAVMVGDVSGVRLEDVDSFARGGEEARAIAAFSNGTANGLSLINVRGQAVAIGTSAGIGVRFQDHQNVRVDASNFYVDGPGSNQTAFKIFGGSGEVFTTNAQIGGSGGDGIYDALYAFNIASGRSWTMNDSKFRCFAGAATRITGGNVIGTSASGSLHLNYTEFFAGSASAQSQIGLRLEGTRSFIRGGNIGVGASGVTTEVVGLDVLPPATGNVGSFNELHQVKINAGHAEAGNDRGAAMRVTGADVFIFHSELIALDDALELGLDGNTANRTGTVGLKQSYLQSGDTPRRSIRKHNNWSFRVVNSELTRSVLVQSGGTAACVATATEVGPTSFLASGCP